MNELQQKTATLLFEIMEIEAIRINSGEIVYVEPIYVNGICGSVYCTPVLQIVDGKPSIKDTYAAVVVKGDKTEWSPSEADIMQSNF